MILSIKSLNITYKSGVLRFARYKQASSGKDTKNKIKYFQISFMFIGQWLVCIDSNMATLAYFCLQIVSN